MKKLICLVMSLVVACTMSISAFAESISEDTKPELTGSEWDGLTLGEDYFIDENGCVVYAFEQIEEITITNKSSRSDDVEDDVILVKTRDGYDPKTKELQFKVNIDCPTSLFVKPDLDISLELLQADTKYGIYESVAKMDWKSLKYLTWYELRSTGTHHYKFIVYLRGSNLSTVVGHSPYEHYSCRNRTGNRWTFYHTDPNSGVVVEEPARTDWQKTTVTRDNKLNEKYQTKYNNAYGTDIVVGKDVGIDVHHVRPLAWGGTDDMYNLVHLDKSFHSKISGWFQGY